MKIEFRNRSNMEKLNQIQVLKWKSAGGELQVEMESRSNCQTVNESRNCKWLESSHDE